MRTWDVPSPTTSLDTNPTLAASVANYALRGESESGGLADFILRRLPGGSSPDRFPSLDDAADTTAPLYTEQIPEIVVSEENVARALTQRIGRFNTLTAGVEAPFRRGNYFDLEVARDTFSAAMGSVMMDAGKSEAFLSAFARSAEQSNQDTRAELASRPLYFDVSVRGDGVHVANILATIQETEPLASVLIICNVRNGMELGGQFRQWGNERPVFQLNSPTRSVEDIQDVYGIPRQGGDLNSLGLHAAMPLAAMSATERATNLQMGKLVAANLAVGQASFLFTADSFVDQSTPLTTIRTPDLPNGIITGTFIDARGKGTPGNEGAQNPYELSVADLWRQVGSYKRGSSSPHPLTQLARKTVLLAGCGDSAKSTAKLILGQGPLEAYAGLSMQEGYLPSRLIWVAEEMGRLGSKAAFKAGTRSAYNSLATNLPEGRGFVARIQPFAGRLAMVVDNIAYLEGRRGRTDAVFADIVLRGTGLIDPGANDPFAQELRMGQLRRDRFGSAYSRSSRADIFSAGPIVELPFRTNSGIPENSVAMALYAPGTTILGYLAAARAKGGRFARGGNPIYS